MHIPQSRLRVSYVLGIGIVCLTLCVAFAWELSKGGRAGQQNASADIFVLGEAEVLVEIADTPDERRIGLSGRPSLAEGTGMFFVFDTVGMHSIWMPDMHFAIDVVWLDEDLDVVHIAEHITPASYPTAFSPTTPARYVLEVPAGFVERHGTQRGTSGVFKAGIPVSSSGTTWSEHDDVTEG